jgi:1,4-alpha-glucan branching enzyme
MQENHMVARSEQGLEFRYSRPDAEQVYLVGDFNGWQEHSLPMSRTKEGEWICCLELPEGVYAFRYLVDGKWCVDRSPFGIGWSPFDCNSVTITNDGRAPAFPLG